MAPNVFQAYTRALADAASSAPFARMRTATGKVVPMKNVSGNSTKMPKEAVTAS